ncbi:MAG: FkbM family methyltransferase [Candidatus Hodarchaeota archaeon]
MVYYDEIKDFLRPSYYRLRKLLRIKSKHEKRKLILEKSYSVVMELSKKDGISDILFENRGCIMTLSDGRKYYFDPLDSVASMYSVPYSGTYETKETQFLKTFIKPKQTCIDVGASFGWYTVLMSKHVGEGGHVYSFEPIPPTFKVLEKNVQLNDCKNVTLSNTGLDETNGQKDFYIAEVGVSGSMKLHTYDKSYDKFRCQCQKLDDYCSKKNVQHVDFIKADIEGAEFLFLKGGKETIRSSKPALMLEIQEHSTALFGYRPFEIFKWLIGYGYTPYIVSDTGSLMKLENYSKKLPDHNFIFIPTEE